MLLGIEINVPSAQIITVNIIQFLSSPKTPAFAVLCVTYCSCTGLCVGPQFLCCFVTWKLRQMSRSAFCAEIQQRLVLQLCQAQPHICSAVSDSKSCYKMEFQVSDGTFCTETPTGAEARTAAVVRSWLGSGGGNDQGKQCLKHQPGVGRVYSLPFAEVLVSH